MCASAARHPQHKEDTPMEDILLSYLDRNGILL